MSAPEPASIYAALRRAFWMIKAPSLALMLSPWCVYLVGAQVLHWPRYGTEGMKLFLAVFLGGFVAGWLVWSFQTPKWRLWAYERVEDLPALKARAIEEKYIWPDGHVFERTEIASPAVRRRIRELEDRKGR